MFWKEKCSHMKKENSHLKDILISNQLVARLFQWMAGLWSYDSMKQKQNHQKPKIGLNSGKAQTQKM